MTTLFVALAACGPGPEQPGLNQPTPYNVVLITFDGVRWQELINGSDPLLTKTPETLFPYFWSTLVTRGRLYGNRREGSAMSVVTIANASLPGYASMYAEREQGCLTNACRRITVPTFVDRVRDELDVPQAKISVFASWSKMRMAVTSREDVASLHCGVAELNEEHAKGPPLQVDGAFDFDRFATSDALAAIDRDQPRYLHLGLLDSDRYGHQRKYLKYVEVLKAYDRVLADVVEHLEHSGEYGRNTAIIVTTDHGRGLWDQWSDHGPQVPGSSHVFAFVMLPAAATAFSLAGEKDRAFTHHDVRYTIETLFGLGTRNRSTGFIAPAGQLP